jgi:anaerobic magnesium-protoporphyrin IX monomethyl ester cyclase
LKILFIEVDTEDSWVVSSLGPPFIASYIRRAGHEAAFLRATVGMSSSDLSARVRDVAPDLIGISLTTLQWPRAREVVADLKAELDLPVVAGGLHPTFTPEVTLSSPGFDFACLGEGEEPVLDLLNALERGTDTRSIRNIWARGGERPLLRAPIASLDDLPWMARDILDEPPGLVHFVTQRGCPFPCPHCAARTWSDLYEHEGRYTGRRRSVENVIGELCAIRESGPLNFVNFLDDTFTLDRRWVREFCRVFREEINVGFSILARVETLTEEILHRLGEAGCTMITYGVESGSPRIRREVLERPVENERFIEVFNWTRAAGIMPIASYMIGLPGETREDLELTLRFAERLDAFDLNTNVYYPYPGTQLGRDCEKRGLLPENHADLPADLSESTLDLEHLSRADVREYFEKLTSLRRQEPLANDGLDCSGTNQQ